MICPVCKKSLDTTCDNDCGTWYCDDCLNEYYRYNRSSKGTTYVIGHHPTCGME